ncbi:MAG: PBSX family phage terminase large subunit [Ruminococcus sp.]|nr:PBSX family phage terminase large subunit [Ruminococcus sp.]
MPNENNLIPFPKRTESEQREIQSSGGKKSGETRRRKKTMKQVMDFLLEQPANTRADYDFLAEQGVDLNGLDPEFVNNMLVVSAALMSKAKLGSVSAVKELRQIIRDDYFAKEKLKLEKEKLRLEKERSEPPEPENISYSGIPASLIAPSFSAVLFDIAEQGHSEYIFPGGRGSGKSSFIGLNVVDLIMKNKDMHACILRAVANTLKDSVYSQILWAISALGLESEFAYTRSPLEITRISTGQKIYFRGADDPNKIKSVKPPFGYIGILWFEELDQFRGEEAVRKIEQSVIRGGDTAYKFKSFNPPKSAQNWANKYIRIPREDRLVTESTYLTVPKKWLGKPFLDDAEFLKETNPAAYENEYMGIVNGTGGAVFDNAELREITDGEISQFDNVLSGVDWGWYPDLYAFVRVHYAAAQHTLYIWQEYTCNKQSNRQTADKLVQLGITGNDIITCDSAENKSVGDYRAYGLLARAAEKGPGSREYSYKWLQSLAKIVIDNKRCPVAAEEFLNCEYDRDKEGNVISGYPDGKDHVIDAVRYATERIWKRRGQ